jgi:hypothetical protein
MTITIDAAADFLNTHSRMFSAEIQAKTRIGLEFETMLPQRSSSGEYYVVEQMEADEVLQPYQGSFTPKGGLSHDESKIRVRPIKMDMQFTETDLEKWWNSWQVSRFDVEKDPETWTYPRYVLEKELMPKFREELNTLAWAGEYAAPTVGVAGDSINAVDGFKKEIATLISSGKIPSGNVYTSGALSTTNIREKIEEFLDSIPEAITAKGGKILMSPTWRRAYVRDYRSEFTQITTTINPDAGRKLPVFVDDYQVELVSMAAMAGSSRLIFLPNGRDNMVWVTRSGAPVYPSMIFKSQARVLQLYATIYRGFGFEYPEEIYCNEQV